ncbi:MAG: GTPase [Planctomycetota bacterium]
MTVAGGHVAILLTPPGTGAIAVIRVIGSAPVEALRPILRPKRQATSAEMPNGSLSLAEIVDENGGEVIDEIIVSPFPYRGQFALDLCLHGSVRIVARVLTVLESRGIRLIDDRSAESFAWPHDYRMDADVYSALRLGRTQRAVRFLAWQRTHLNNFLQDLSDSMGEHPHSARDCLQRMMDRGRQGVVLVEGANVVLIGPPNSGKSTLFNRLVGRQASVVSAQAGTTRDWVTADVDFEGVPIRLVDTAGRRKEADALEQLAVTAGLDMSENADVILLILDGSTELTDEAKELLGRAGALKNAIVIWNKADIRAIPGVGGDVFASALTGTGVDEIVRLVLNHLGFSDWKDRGPAFFTGRQLAWGSDVLAAMDHQGLETGRKMFQDFVRMGVDSTRFQGLQ